MGGQSTRVLVHRSYPVTALEHQVLTAKAERAMQALAALTLQLRISGLGQAADDATRLRDELGRLAVKTLQPAPEEASGQ